MASREPEIALDRDQRQSVVPAPEATLKATMRNFQGRPRRRTRPCATVRRPGRAYQFFGRNYQAGCPIATYRRSMPCFHEEAVALAQLIAGDADNPGPNRRFTDRACVTRG